TSSAAGFQSWSRRSGSSRKTPSPTAARTRAACSRSAAVTSARARPAAPPGPGLGLGLVGQPRVAPRGRHQADQAFRELELLLVVLGRLVHELDDADALALGLGGQHHPPLPPRRPPPR